MCIQYVRHGISYYGDVMITCLVADMPPGGGSERYTRGRLSPNPLSMGMHSTLARDELLPPTREELRLLSGSHFDPPSLEGVRGSFLSSLSVGDREPSLLDQVMAERQRGGWRLDDDPLLMSRRHDEFSRQQDDMARQQNEISRQQDEMTRRHNESSRRFDEETSESGGRRVFLRNVRLCVCVCTCSLMSFESTYCGS